MHSYQESSEPVSGIEYPYMVNQGGAPESPPYSPPSGSLSPPSPSARSDSSNSSESKGETNGQQNPSSEATGKNAQGESKSSESSSPEHRRYRTAFTREQISRLEKEFLRENYITKPKRTQLAEELKLEDSTIKVWFQNRRMKDKRQRLSFTLPYTDPAVASYLFHAVAASGYTPYLTPPVTPWSNPGLLGMGTVPPMPYSPSHVNFMGSHPSMGRFTPYPNPRSPVLHPYSPMAAEVHHQPQVPTSTVPLSGMIPFPPVRSHAPACSNQNTAPEHCHCNIMYSPFGTPGVPYAGLTSSYPAHMPSDAHPPPRAAPLTPTENIQDPVSEDRLNRPNKSLASPPQKSIVTSTTVGTPKLFKPYDNDSEENS